MCKPGVWCRTSPGGGCYAEPLARLQCPSCLIVGVRIESQPDAPSPAARSIALVFRQVFLVTGRRLVEGPMRWYILVLLLGFGSVAYAGDNQYGQACLSWAAGDGVTKSDTAQALFPVYVHVDGASSIRGLSVCLRWYPNSYVLVNPPSTWEADVGYNIDVAPHATFANDTSSFDATIVFPTYPGDHAVIAYWFRYAGAGAPPPASFCLSEVKAMDGTGQVDRLGLLDGLSLAGGATVGGCPPTPSSIARGELLIHLRPKALSPTATRELASPQDTLSFTRCSRLP